MPITYKCPNCGAAMEFDSTAQKLKCPSCQMEMDVQDYEKQYGHLYSDAEAGENAQSAQSEGQKGKGSMNMKVYHYLERCLLTQMFQLNLKYLAICQN